MKKLQLFKHVAGEIAKNKSPYPKIFIGEVNEDIDYISNAYVVWLIARKENPFKPIEDKGQFDKVTLGIDELDLEMISDYIILQDDSIIKGKQFARGVFKGEDFYFNPDLLKYFDKTCSLWKNSEIPYIYIREKGNFVGVVCPLMLDDEDKEKINKKLGL